MVLIIPYNVHHQNQEHKKNTSMLQKTVKGGKVQEMGTS
jgi:hypothetical protein